MRRYFFHVSDAPDREGELLPDMREVKRNALGVFTEILAARADKVWDSGAFSVTVEDDEGAVVAVLSAAAVVR